MPLSPLSLSTFSSQHSNATAHIFKKKRGRRVLVAAAPSDCIDEEAERQRWQNWDDADGGEEEEEGEETNANARGKRPFACPICSKRYGTLGGILKHQRNARSPIRPHCCTICDKRFALVAHRDRHILSKHRSHKKPFVCDLCGKRYTRRESLLAHSLRLHPSPSSSPSSSSSWRPYVHGEKENEEKAVAVVVCEICYGTFSRWSQLVKHHSQCHTRRDDFPEVAATGEEDYVSLETLLELNLLRHHAGGGRSPRETLETSRLPIPVVPVAPAVGRTETVVRRRRQCGCCSTLRSDWIAHR